MRNLGKVCAEVVHRPLLCQEIVWLYGAVLMSQSDRRYNNSDLFCMSTERRRFFEEKKEVRPKVTKRTDLFEARSVVMREIDTVLIQN